MQLRDLLLIDEQEDHIQGKGRSDGHSDHISKMAFRKCSKKEGDCSYQHFRIQQIPVSVMHGK